MNPAKTSEPSAAQLAVIIPAYKTDFLRATLASIAAQTDKNFQLYVFDDCSPEPVEAIVREFSGGLPLKFHRFEKNLGGISLVRHWERCVRLTGEPWVWIFADDDLMEPGCVADFFAELERTHAAHDLYRFNTTWVDEAGAQISESPRHPPAESGADFLLARLSGTRNTTLQELIFSRRAWTAVGGIPDFPLAWHSDEAFAGSLGVKSPLRAIPGARVNWRYSRQNITGTGSFKTTNKKIISTTAYFRWLAKFFQANAAPRTAEAARISEQWLMHYARCCWEFLGLRTCLALDSLAAEIWHRPRGWVFFKGLEMNLILATNKARRFIGGRK